MLQKFIVGLLIEAAKELAKDEDVREFVADQIARLARLLKDDLLPDIVATFPAFGAGLLKTALELPGSATEIAAETVKKIAESDPDIPGLSNIFDLSAVARKWLGL